ncbi:hypothetical protein sos41_13820 [Alphaproteobacteria bacterium SO-S41]|nr:hypothetical protein sos41_13820 [Alphaproteobacteria bacterium SO-S41]
MKRTEGEIWVVGASRGLGQAVATCFAEAGRPVVGMARQAPAERRGFADFVTVDVADPVGFETAVAALFRARPTPGLIVYCASVVSQGAVLNRADRDLRQEVDTNYLGFVRLARAVAAHKPVGVQIRLVATASTLGYVGCPSLDNYSAAKAAVISFVRSARGELAAKGIEVAVLSPPHMENGADLRGSQLFTMAWSAPRFARAADGSAREYVLGFSNRQLLWLRRLAPALAQWIMTRIGRDALARGATRDMGVRAAPAP